MPTYKLNYFEITGLGESLRYMLSYGGVKFEDRRYSFQEWPKYKSSMPMHQLPVLEIDGKMCNQSKCLLRYLAKKFGLYSTNDEEAYLIDAAVDDIDDMRIALSTWYWEENEVVKEHLKDPGFKKIAFCLDKFEERVKKNNGYFANGKLSCADILWGAYSDYLSRVLGHDLNKDHPALKKLAETVFQMPKIKAYLEKRPKTVV